MNLTEWIPAITTSGLLAAILWLARNLIKTRLTKSVEHEFNTRLEALKAQMRESEERLKADLRAKETEIAVLRSGAMSALASRQIAVDKRRLEAVDQLWSAVTALAPAQSISSMMAVIKFEEAAKSAQHDPNARQLFETMGCGFDPKTLDLSGATKARPFLSPMAWATYNAFLSICMHAVMRWQAIKCGIGPHDFTDNEAIKKLIKTALPHYGDYIDKQGPLGYHYLLESLEIKLLQEIHAMLAGVEADKASIEQAAEILRRSSDVLNEAHNA